MIRIKGAGDPVWCVPYIGNFAAMALLAANDLQPNPEDVDRVERWLLWYGRNQESDGTICDQEGKVAAYKSNGRRDSTDSYAATFLMVAHRWRKAVNGAPRPEVLSAATRALGAIEAVVQTDGLTIAKPDYPMKYLMDNIEIYGGLAEGALFFDSVGKTEEANRCRRLAERVAAGLRGFWSEKEQCFAVSLDMKCVYTVGLSKPFPHGLAQLFALAHIDGTRTELWLRVRKSFKPGDEGMPIERWLIAANRCASRAEMGELREATREAMLHFTGDSVYVERPALAIIALIDGKARFCDLPR
ncbi:MAG TPA: hypothetical protein VGP72_12190 [Planctomycetota bacterium]